MKNTRPELTFDGCGINGPDEYRTRVCTFTEWGLIANKYGPMFAAAPETAAELERMKKLCAIQHRFGVPSDEYAQTRAAGEALAEALRDILACKYVNIQAALAQWEASK